MKELLGERIEGREKFTHQRDEFTQTNYLIVKFDYFRDGKSPHEIRDHLGQGFQSIGLWVEK